MMPLLSKVIGWAEQEYEACMKRREVPKAGGLQAIVVAPSRELAMQIMHVGQSLLPPTARSYFTHAIGGANKARQVYLSPSSLPPSGPKFANPKKPWSKVW